MFLRIPDGDGLDHRTLRQEVAAYLGLDLPAHTAGQMTYELRRLRLKGILWRITGTHRYLIKPYGRKVAMLFTKLDARVSITSLAAVSPAKRMLQPLDYGFAEVDRRIEEIVHRAGLSTAPETWVIRRHSLIRTSKARAPDHPRLFPEVATKALDSHVSVRVYASLAEVGQPTQKEGHLNV